MCEVLDSQSTKELLLGLGRTPTTKSNETFHHAAQPVREVVSALSCFSPYYTIASFFPVFIGQKKKSTK